MIGFDMHLSFAICLQQKEPTKGMEEMSTRSIYRHLLLPVSALSIFISAHAMAIEEPKYRVLKNDGDFEIRQYDSFIVAETVVDTSDYEEASNEGFRRLAAYIFGENKSRQKMAMTSPVTTEQSEKIAMTAPVQTEQSGTTVRIAFVIPSEYTMQTLPVPNDARITLHPVPGRKVAVVNFSGRWTESNFHEHTEELQAWIQKEGLREAGNPIVARYNPPFVPSFFRRNEILIPIE